MVFQKTILLVDDSKTIINTVSLVLSSNYNILTAYDGTDALKYINYNADIDLVITDYHMPEMNGIELIKIIRSIQKYKKIPILILTTNTQAEKKRMAKNVGATGWITKPFSSIKLKSVIKKLI